MKGPWCGWRITRLGYRPNSRSTWIGCLSYSLRRHTHRQVWLSVSPSSGDDVFQWLLDSDRLVRVGEDVVFAPESYEAMLQRILEHLHTAGSITVAQVRDMFGTSRKYALALMEHLDAKHITRRVGDERVLRKGGGTKPSGLP